MKIEQKQLPTRPLPKKDALTEDVYGHVPLIPWANHVVRFACVQSPVCLGHIIQQELTTPRNLKSKTQLLFVEYIFFNIIFRLVVRHSDQGRIEDFLEGGSGFSKKLQKNVVGFFPTFFRSTKLIF